MLPLLKIFADPIPGLLALSVLLVTLVGKRRLPWGLPGALVSALVGIAAFYLLRWAHFTSPLLARSSAQMAALHLSFPWPSLAFLGGLSTAWGYLPIALPFALSTVVGGIDNTESAAAAGDEYDTRGILLTEGFCTLAAGLCGGVVESTPYIGHPAFKRMGAGAGYAILTGLFIGIGGIVGVLPFFVDWIPASAIAPVLVYIGLEVIAQAFLATPRTARPGSCDFVAAFVRVSDFAGDKLSAGCAGRARRSDSRPGWRNAAHGEFAWQRIHHRCNFVGCGYCGADRSPLSRQHSLPADGCGVLSLWRDPLSNGAREPSCCRGARDLRCRGISPLRT